MLAFVGNFGVWETLLIAVVIVLVFGGRLPEVARDAMRTVYKLRRSLDHLRREVDLDGELDRIRKDVHTSIEGPRPTPRGGSRGRPGSGADAEEEPGEASREEETRESSS